MYKVFYHRRARKHLKKLPKADQIKIATKVSKLQLNPLNHELDIVRYQKAKKSWRVRTGNLRIIYTFNSKQKIILIEFLGYRGSIYKKF